MSGLIVSSGGMFEGRGNAVVIAAQFRSGAQSKSAPASSSTVRSEMGLPNRSCRRALAPARSAAAERGSLDRRPRHGGNRAQRRCSFCPVGRHHRRDGRQWRRCHLERRRREWRDDQQGRHRERAFRRFASASTLDSGGRRSFSAGTAFLVMVKGGGPQSSPAWPTLCSYPLAASRTSAAAAPPRPLVSGGAGKVFGGGFVLGGGLFGFTVNSGGVEIANSGGTTSAIAVASGGELIIRSGGTALHYDTSRRPGAGQRRRQKHRHADLQRRDEVFNGGLDSGAAVNSSGIEFVSSGGVGSGATVSNAGVQEIGRGGKAVGATLVSGGTQIVSSGGVASTTTISSGGVLEIDSGGKGVGATILSGGMQIISGHGLASVALVSDGGSRENSLAAPITTASSAAAAGSSLAVAAPRST